MNDAEKRKLFEELIADGLMEKRWSIKHQDYEYRLTTKGIALAKKNEGLTK